MRSEAIRRVKLVLEKAGMDMPEPIYRVQLREMGKVESGKEATAKPVVTETPPSEPVDTRANKDVQEQIDVEKSTAQTNNLLDPDAARE